MTRDDAFRALEGVKIRGNRSFPVWTAAIAETLRQVLGSGFGIVQRVREKPRALAK